MAKIRLDLRDKKNASWKDCTVESPGVPDRGEFLQVESQTDPENGEPVYFKIVHRMWSVAGDQVTPILRGRMVDVEVAGAE